MWEVLVVDLNFVKSFLRIGDHIIYQDTKKAPTKSYQITQIDNNNFYHDNNRIFKLKEKELYNFSINANGVFTIHVINKKGFYVCCFKGIRDMYQHSMQHEHLEIKPHNKIISVDKEIAVYLI